MTDMKHFITTLLKNGIKIYVEQGKLRTSASKGAITAQIGATIKANKDQIIALLQSQTRQVADALPSDTPVIGPANVTHPPLSFSQQRLWLLDQISPGGTQYNVPVALNLDGELNLGALQQALASIVERHQVLRTVYRKDENGGVYQQVLDQTLTLGAVTDLSALTEQQREQQVNAYLALEQDSPFELSQQLMIRAQVLKLSVKQHLLLVNMHHIASDGWSMGILVTELSQLYTAYVNAQANPLPSLAIQYSDYAQWQRTSLSPQVLRQQLDFWTKNLAGAPAVHGLPLDYARSAVADFKGGLVEQSLSPTLQQQLNALANATGATLFMVLNAAFACLIGRYSGQDDIVIGSPMANREQPELAPLVGFFVNTLVLRTDLSADPSFQQLLAQGKQQFVAASDHQQLPFEKLVDELNVERRLSHNPLFQLMLVLQNNQSETFSLPGLELSPRQLPGNIAKFDLTLGVTEEDGLQLSWEYASALFKRQTIIDLGEQFAVMLQAIVDTPQSRVSELPLLSALHIQQWQQQSRQQMHDSRTAYPENDCIHHLFVAQVKHTPQAVALELDQQTVTYTQLEQRANQLAHHLMALGVRPDTLVGLCVDRSITMMVAMLAILKAGGAYVPLDPHYPSERLRYIIDDAKIHWVLGHSDVDLTTWPEALPEELVWVMADDQALADYATDAPVVADLNAHHLAYVIYTSGSTGQPKGVLTEHHNVVRLMRASEKHYDFNRHDVWTLFHSCAFDFSVWEIWGALAYGGKLVIVPHWTARSTVDFYHLLHQAKVTVLNQTPSAFNALIAQDRQASRPLPLRYVIFGGEALTLSALKPWFDKHGDQHPCLVNMYGITETTVHVTYKRILVADIAGAASYIGEPLADLTLMLLSPGQQLVPQGAIGEMYVAGGGLARGYLGRDALTAERFIHHPLLANARLYRTGDLARFDRCGELEYIGRADDQLKLRGFRIEPGEIVAALLSHDEVLEAVVTVAGENQQLTAYIVADDSANGNTDLAARLSVYLPQHLPDYMVPSAYVLLAELPLTANGKLDTKALPQPDISAQMAARYIAPETEQEQQLCHLWQTLLGLEQVGVSDNFFSIGGDSIRAITLVTQAAEQGLDFSVKDLFLYQNIRQLATAMVGEQTQAVRLSDIAPFSLLPASMQTTISELSDEPHVLDAFPLSQLQRGMLYHNMLNHSDGIYHDVFSFRLNSRWQQGVFAAALTELVARHEVLRSRFKLSGEQPVQVIYAELPLPLTVIDLSAYDDKAQQQTIDQWVQKQSASAFDFAVQPWQVVIHRLAEAQFYYHLSFHHALLDGWSVASLNTELFDIYQALLNQQPLIRPLPPLPYKHFIAQEQQVLAQPALLDYWRDILDDAPLLWWASSQRGKTHQTLFQLSVADSDALLALARQYQVQEKSVLLCIHLLLMALISGNDDVVTSVVSNARVAAPGGERTLGLFLNTLPLRLQGVSQSPWSALMVAADKALSEVMIRSSYPLAEVQRLTGGDFSHSLFNFIDFHVYRQVADDVSLLDADIFEKTNYQLSLDFVKDNTDGSISISLSLDGGVFSAEFGHRMCGYLGNIVGQMIDPAQASPDLPALLPQAEIQQLIPELELALGKDQQGDCIHQRFAVRAKQYPDAVALQLDQQTLTYGQLDTQANQLAHHLMTLGVRPDRLVGLCVDRSITMVVAMLAILKAGGAYVPLDPHYPSERLHYIIDDAKVQLVVGHSAVDHQVFDRMMSQGLTWVVADDSALADYSDNAPEVEGLTADHLAYVIYTSGSTGQPKGVLIEHRNIVRLFDSSDEFYQFNRHDVWTLFHSCAFDFSVWEIWGALNYGAKLVIVPYWTARSTADFYQLLIEAKVTVLNQTPSAFNALVSYDRQQSLELELKLRYVIFGGEALTLSALQPWCDKYGDARPILVNMYGITETTVHVTYKRIMATDIASTSSYIGQPLADLGLMLLSPALQLVPKGAIGEMHVAGGGVARGYLGRDNLTAERFIHHPLLPKQRLYRSGDLARFDEQGELEYMGRSDDQLKLRGFRIEPGEIVGVLLSHPQVREAAVILTGDNPQLTAYLVLDTEVETTVLQPYLQQHLPEHMVPSTLMTLAELPLTVNGKLNHKALPKPAFDQQIAQTYEPPQNDIERCLCQIWQTLLGLTQVGVMDNFFTIGGDSIRAISVVTQAKAAGLLFSLKDLAQQKNIRQLAQAIDAEQTVSYQQTEIEPFALLPLNLQGSLKNGELQDGYPLSMLQRGMVYHNLMATGDGIYHDIFSFCLQSHWQEALFAQALGEVVNRHDALRSRFDIDAQEPWQQVYRQIELPLSIIDLTSLEAEHSDKQVQQWIADESVAAFDFAKPLWRVVIHLLAEDKFYYHLSFHHALLDGWSVASLNTELFGIYLQLQQGQNLDPQPAPLAYKHFIQQEQQVLSEADNAVYWQGKFVGTVLPWWASDQRKDSIVLHQQLSSSDSEALFTLARQHQVQEKSLLLAIHLVLMAMLSGEQDIMTSVVGNGRLEAPGGESTLGLFLNSLPLRVQVGGLEVEGHGGQHWAELIQNADQALAELMTQRSYPLSEVQRLTGLDFSHSLFNYVDFHVYQQVIGEVKLLDANVFEKTNYQLDVNFAKNSLDGSLAVALTLDSQAFSQAFAQRIAGYLNHIIRALIDHTEQAIHLAQLLGKVDLDRLHHQYNDTALEQPASQRIDQLFSDQVQRTPAAIALRYEDQSLSYQQLEQQANRVANGLLEQGIQSGMLVGLCIERSLEMVVAQLAILKVGAAYVPLDPEYPEARLHYMVAHCALKWVLTQSSCTTRFDCHRIELDDKTLWAKFDETCPVIAESSDLAYVIYTSGSTGQPKGVMVSHDNVMNLLHGLVQPLAVDEQTRLLAVTSLSFDIHVLEIFLPLCFGACVTVASAEQSHDPQLLAALIDGHKINFMQATPATWTMLLAQQWQPSQAFTALCGGERLPLTLKQGLLEHSNMTLWNMYGPTETTVWSTMAKMHRDIPVNIGTPIANTRCYVLNRQGQLVADGVPGELHIGGAGVTRGYLHQPQMSKQQFIDHAVYPLQAQLLYRTGDLARWNDRGVLECLGRIDQQIKVRGFRVEPGEIGRQLMGHDQVADAAITLESDETLVAYVVLSSTIDLLETLGTYLHQLLPGYMVPSEFIKLEALPQTPNGKLDVKALSVLRTQMRADSAGDAGTRQYQPPQTETEKQLCVLWQTLLNQPQVGLNDNFFAIGGHSLVATRMVASIRQQWSLHIALKDALTHQTPKALAVFIDQQKLRATSSKDQVMPAVTRRTGRSRRNSHSMTSVRQDKQ